MSHMLRIDASARHEGSVSRDVADKVAAQWAAANPGGKVLTRDLVAAPRQALHEAPRAGPALVGSEIEGDFMLFLFELGQPVRVKLNERFLLFVPLTHRFRRAEFRCLAAPLAPKNCRR